MKNRGRRAATRGRDEMPDWMKRDLEAKQASSAALRHQAKDLADAAQAERREKHLAYMRKYMREYRQGLRRRDV